MSTGSTLYGRRLALIGLGLLFLAGLAWPAPARAQTKVELRLGHGNPVDTPVDRGVKRLAELVAERSGGTIVLRTYAMSLGNENQLIEGLQTGAVDMAANVAPSFGTVLPLSNVLGILYLFRDLDHMQKVMRGPVGARISTALLEKWKIHVIDQSWYFGTRQLSSNRPVTKPEDLRGMKVRVLPVPIYTAAWRALGATPTPIPFPDLFAAIQNNLVDAQENPLPNIKGAGFHLLHKHLTLTSHIISSWVVSISDSAYQRLTPEQHRIIAQAVKDAGAYQDKLALDSEEAILKEWQQSGAMTVYVPDRAAFKARVAKLPAEFEGGILNEMYGLIQNVK
jgi:tripartite ATP-independent transporter DctP family solute receptor